MPDLDDFDDGLDEEDFDEEDLGFQDEGVAVKHRVDDDDFEIDPDDFSSVLRFSDNRTVSLLADE